MDIKFLNLPELTWIQFKLFVDSLSLETEQKEEKEGLETSCERVYSLLEERMQDMTAPIAFQLHSLVQPLLKAPLSELPLRYYSLLPIQQIYDLVTESQSPKSHETPQIGLCQVLSLVDVQTLFNLIWSFTSYQHIIIVPDLTGNLPSNLRRTLKQMQEFVGSVPRSEESDILLTGVKPSPKITVSNIFLIDSIRSEMEKLKPKKLQSILLLQYTQPEQEEDSLQKIMKETMLHIWNLYLTPKYQVTYRYFLFFLFHAGFRDVIKNQTFWISTLQNQLIMPACIPTLHSYG